MGALYFRGSDSQASTTPVGFEPLLDSIESVVRESFDYNKNTGQITLYEKE
jgi:hypothetical protein